MQTTRPIPGPSVSGGLVYGLALGEKNCAFFAVLRA